jgi:hypothetical protein
MKLTAVFALVLAATFISTGNASAQDHRVDATVPFNFTVGSQALPAGHYTIGSDVTNPQILNLTSREKKVNIQTVGRPDQSSTEHSNVLVFHKYGDQYFLSEIRSEGAGMNIHFAPAKAEKLARARTEEAGRFVNDPILVAVNR